MITVVGRSGNLNTLLRATTAAGASTAVPIVPPVPEENIQKFQPAKGWITSYSSSYNLPVKKMTAISGPGVKCSVRFNHTDVKVPDFDPYRLSSRTNPESKSSDTEDNAKFYTSAVMALTGAGTAYFAKGVATKLVSYMAASADVLAMAKIEINKKDIPEGKNVVFKWRGKPLFVRHRTQGEIVTESQVDVSSLRHPEHDKDRTKDPKWLVVLGVCTHLGCVPISNQGDWNGYYCPCHGSHYDASGRIRKGPAPLNLEVPPYEIVGETIVVG